MRNDRPASRPYVRCIAWIVVLGLFAPADALPACPAQAAARRRRARPRARRPRRRSHGQGAVGLLVPDAGPRTSGARARAALERGRCGTRSSAAPRGRATVSTRQTAGPCPADRVIVLGLPTGGEQPQRPPVPDRRPRRRLPGRPHLRRRPGFPGLVSIVDVAPTALGEDGALGSSADDDPLGTLDGPRRAHRGEPGREDGRPAPVPRADRRRRDLLPGRRPCRRSPACSLANLALGAIAGDRGLDRRAGPRLHRRRRPASGARGTGRPRPPHGRRARRLPGGDGGRRALGRPLAARPDAELALLRALEPAGDAAPGPGAAPAPSCSGVASGIWAFAGRGGALARHGRRKLVRSGRRRRARPARRLPRPGRRSSSASTGDWRSAAPRSPSCWWSRSPWAARAT